MGKCRWLCMDKPGASASDKCGWRIPTSLGDYRGRGWDARIKLWCDPRLRLWQAVTYLPCVLRHNLFDLGRAETHDLAHGACGETALQSHEVYFQGHGPITQLSLNTRYTALPRESHLALPTDSLTRQAALQLLAPESLRCLC